MADIFDLKPATSSVDVDGKAVTIQAIDLAGMLQIVTRFPALMDLIGGKHVTYADLAGAGSVAAIIAAGCGKVGDAEAEALAASFDADTQSMLLWPILSLSMPRGAVPFLVRLTGFADVLKPSEPMSREELARKILAKNLQNSSQQSSSNTEVPSVAIAS